MEEYGASVQAWAIMFLCIRSYHLAAGKPVNDITLHGENDSRKFKKTHHPKPLIIPQKVERFGQSEGKLPTIRPVLYKNKFLKSKWRRNSTYFSRERSMELLVC